jgi:hypothetical protein
MIFAYLTPKKTAKQLAYRSRHLALTSSEQVKCRKLKKIIKTLIVKSENDQSNEDIDYLLKLFVAKYISLAYSYEIPSVSKRYNRNRTINSFTNSECYINFRFRSAELKRLYPLLKFGEQCILENGINMPGEELFLRGLYELCSGENQEHIAANIFGSEHTRQGRAFKYFIHHMYNNFAKLVKDNLTWWFRNNFAALSAAAIGGKMNMGGDSFNLVAVFIDCNCLPTEVIGGGPADNGANAMRWDENIQRAFYNGWKSIHGLKHQTINDAFGICPDMEGPTSLRRNDLTLLRLSRIVDRFQEEQQGNILQYIMMGDSAYKKKSHITSYHRADELIEDFKAWNNAMKKVRISIEWDYGYTASLFKYVTNKRKLQVLNGDTVSKIYTVATVFRNIHAGFYGCQTSNYFSVCLPDNYVEKYLTQTDF